MLIMSVNSVSVFIYSQKVVQTVISKKVSLIVQSIVFSEQVIGKLAKAQ